MTGNDAASAPRSAGETDPVVTVGEAAAELRERYDELRRLEGSIEELGNDRVETAADAFRQAHRVLDSYEDDATGTGDFGAYLKFESAFTDATSTAADALGADAFEAASEAVDKRRLSQADFDRARSELDPVEQYVSLLEDRDEAVDDYRLARRELKRALEDLQDHISDLQRVAEMADADLSADVDRLRDPVESYNEAVRDAFESFRKEASARELFDFLALTERYPLVDVDQPPRELAEYVAEYPAGEEPLPTLLEYVEYSPSKLEHYIDDPGALRTTVAVHRTYLDRIDAAPLTIDWPPPAADELRYLLKELIPIVSRLDAEDAVVQLRALRKLATSDEYGTLHRAAEVRTSLDDDELALLQSGDVNDELTLARDAQALAEAVLAETDR